jgi:hypothetical protein
MPWRPDHPARLAERLLTEHFLGMRTNGASFAIDPHEGELVLWKACALSTLDEHSFALLVASFLQSASRWRDELEAAPRTADHAAEPGFGLSRFYSELA